MLVSKTVRFAVSQSCRSGHIVAGLHPLLASGHLAPRRHDLTFAPDRCIIPLYDMAMLFDN